MHLVFSAEPCPRLRILEEEDPVARGGTQRYVRRRVPTLAFKVAPAFPALYAGCDRTKTATPRSTALRQSLTSSVLFSTLIRRQSRVSSPSTYSLTNKISPSRGPVKGSFAEFSPAGRPAPAEKILSFPPGPFSPSSVLQSATRFSLLPLFCSQSRHENISMVTTVDFLNGLSARDSSLRCRCYVTGVLGKNS